MPDTPLPPWGSAMTERSIFETMAAEVLRRAGVEPSAENVAEYLSEMSSRSMKAREKERRQRASKVKGGAE